jgi:3-oxoacyl-(acyl-carrier-protein) reductase
MSIDLEESANEPFAQPCMTLQGKKALVTGGSRGIGRAIALTLAAQGADVALTYYTGCKFAEDVSAKIRDMGRLSGCYAHDIADRESVGEVRSEVMADLGQIDILVNNAGIARDRSFKKMTLDMWDDVLAVNLTGVFHMAKQFIDDMGSRGWGRVINISSVVGEIGNFGQANYAASKAGVIGLTKTLAREYARRGVTVNAIAPGFIKTRMMQGIPENALQKVIDLTPMARLGEPEEIAAGVAFLASPAAGFITGHVLDINGGMKM